MKGKLRPAPGARVVIRDAEWLVQTTESTRSGAMVLKVVGVSDFTRRKSGV
jgi:hypothetical protein